MLGTKLSEYHVTESGFGTDVGYEKFWNLKCRMSGLTPDAVVIVTTIRALKMHGGGPTVKPGIPLSLEYTTENPALLEKGCENLLAHIEIVRKSGIQPIVCINSFCSDTEDEKNLVKKFAESNGAISAVSEHWLKGGDGAIELAEAVLEACNRKNDFRFLYDLSMPLRHRIELIAKEVYGAKAVTYTEKAIQKAISVESDPTTNSLGTCMVKTHSSLSHNPDIKGRPRDWTLPISDILIYKGAGLVAPVAGNIKLMPGTASNPAFRRIDVDANTGKVRGLF
jgi:formate--tetrahydrofolate ligase